MHMARKQATADRIFKLLSMCRRLEVEWVRAPSRIAGHPALDQVPLFGDCHVHRRPLKTSRPFQENHDEPMHPMQDCAAGTDGPDADGVKTETEPRGLGANGVADPALALTSQVSAQHVLMPVEISWVAMHGAARHAWS